MRDRNPARLPNCHCSLVVPGMPGVTEPLELPCHLPVSGPDSPFCVGCEDNHVGHDTVPWGQLGAKVVIRA